MKATARDDGRTRGRLSAHLLIFALTLSAGWLVAEQASAHEVYSPDNVKAAFLYHFGSYIEWPDRVDESDKFVIGVLGAEPVARELMRIAPGRSVAGRHVEIRHMKSVGEMGTVHILYVGADASARLPQVIAAVRGRPVLLVSDAQNGLQQGAIINFTLSERRVRFEISLPEAHRAGLALSSRLLSVALRVEKTGKLQDVWRGRSARLAHPWAGQPADRPTGLLARFRDRIIAG